MSKQLSQIKQPIQEDLNEFNQLFKSTLTSKVSLLNTISKYVVKTKGKQVRPLFVLLTAKMIGEINRNTYIASSLIELMHTATLVHDDIVDDAQKRRGAFSINALWKNKIAVLVGDFLLSRSLLLAIDEKQFDQLENLSEAVKAMSEGELMQIEKARKLDITEDIYFKIIKAKTASLIKASCKAGAMSVTNDEAIIKQFGEIGENIGIAFQIKDDLFDYGTTTTGKAVGIDIKEKKMTLPLIYTLNHVDGKTKRSIIRTIKKHNLNKEKVNEVIDIVKKSGGMEYAGTVMKDYAQRAIEALQDVPESEAKQSFIDLIHFTINRNR